MGEVFSGDTMTWEDAVELSPFNLAVRRDRKGDRFVRDENGETQCFPPSGAPHDASAEDVEGHGDWEPLGPRQPTAVSDKLEDFEKVALFQYVKDMGLPPWAEDEKDAFAVLLDWDRERVNLAYGEALRRGLIELAMVEEDAEGEGTDGG